MPKYRVPVEFEAANHADAKRFLANGFIAASNKPRLEELESMTALDTVNLIYSELLVAVTHWEKVS
jgi:hypothetical protein